jgi:hypothetical protein
LKRYRTTLCLLAALAPAHARAAALAHGLAGLGFLVGSWSSGQGKVAETGGTSTGSSVFTLEAGGGVLLRRDHTNLFTQAGKPAGGFDQIMMIYPDAGQIHADYADGSHIIHYTTASVRPGQSVTFISTAPPGAPAFQLAYSLANPTTLAVAFAMLPPGGGPARPIAVGTLHRLQ